MTTMVSAAYAQQAYRGYGDGTQTGSTAAANQDTGWTQDVDAIFQVRVRIAQTVANANQNNVKAFKLRFQQNGTGGFVDVGAPGAATAVRYIDSASITDNEGITTGNFRLTGGTGTAVAGEVNENATADNITFPIAGSASHTECLWIVELNSALVADEDTFEFRAYESGDTALAAYTVTASVTANVPDTVDDLLANDVSSASSVSVPAIGQAHVLNASDVASASSVGLPALAQVHALTANDVASASSVSVPAIAIVTPLLAEDVASASSVSAPSIAQIHALLAAGVASGSAITLPAVGQVHALLAADVASGSSLSLPVLEEISGVDDLTANDVASASSLSAPALAQIHVLLANDVQSGSLLSVPAISGPYVTHLHRKPVHAEMPGLGF